MRRTSRSAPIPRLRRMWLRRRYASRSGLEHGGIPSTVLAGNQITYTQTVTNNGPAAAAGATFTEATPAEHYVSNPFRPRRDGRARLRRWRHRERYLHESECGVGSSGGHYCRGLTSRRRLRRVDHCELFGFRHDLRSACANNSTSVDYERKRCLRSDGDEQRKPKSGHRRLEHHLHANHHQSGPGELQHGHVHGGHASEYDVCLRGGCDYGRRNLDLPELPRRCPARIRACRRFDGNDHRDVQGQCGNDCGNHY